MSDRLQVIGRPAEGIHFENPPKFCPQCGGDKLEPKRWYARQGDMLMAECSVPECDCHFGVSGWTYHPEDGLCEHAWAKGIEADGETPSGKDRCFKCGEERA